MNLRDDTVTTEMCSMKRMVLVNNITEQTMISDHDDEDYNNGVITNIRNKAIISASIDEEEEYKVDGALDYDQAIADIEDTIHSRSEFSPSVNSQNSTAV